MAKFTPDQAAAALAIQQAINEWSDELDKNNGLEMGSANVLTQDVQYFVGGEWRDGIGAVCEFYKGRVAQHTAGAGVPVMRHVMSNYRVYFDSASEARCEYLLTFFVRVGTPPFMDWCDPTAVADVRMVCRKEADGEWRISRFDSNQIFIRGA